MAYLMLGSAFTSDETSVEKVSVSSTGIVSASPVDLTSMVLTGYVDDLGSIPCEPLQPLNALAMMTEGNGITVIDPPNGIFTWSLTAAQGRSIRSLSWAPVQLKRPLTFSLWNLADAGNPQFLYREPIWGYV
jgi:hypothetical protein